MPADQFAPDSPITRQARLPVSTPPSAQILVSSASRNIFSPPRNIASSLGSPPPPVPRLGELSSPNGTTSQKAAPSGMQTRPPRHDTERATPLSEPRTPRTASAITDRSRLLRLAARARLPPSACHDDRPAPSRQAAKDRTSSARRRASDAPICRQRVGSTPRRPSPGIGGGQRITSGLRRSPNFQALSRSPGRSSASALTTRSLVPSRSRSIGASRSLPRFREPTPPRRIVDGLPVALVRTLWSQEAPCRAFAPPHRRRELALPLPFPRTRSPSRRVTVASCAAK